MSDQFPALRSRRNRSIDYQKADKVRRVLWRAFQHGALSEDELASTVERLDLRITAISYSRNRCTVSTVLRLFVFTRLRQLRATRDGGRCFQVRAEGRTVEMLAAAIRRCAAGTSSTRALRRGCSGLARARFLRGSARSSPRAPRACRPPNSRRACGCPRARSATGCRRSSANLGVRNRAEAVQLARGNGWL
jgi:hypothetical protein